LIWIVFIIAAVVIADAIRARANLRLQTRATHGARQQHDLIAGASGSGAWRSLNEDAGERSETEPRGDNPFAKLLGGNSQRDSRRQPL
jgi:hypothetical protein